MVGLRVGGVVQILDSFCDDLSLVTNQLSDFRVIDEAVVKFESVSGAILSRNKKCKVMGFGAWKDKVDWPLDYLETVKEIKVLGIYLSDSYRTIIKRNWDFRFNKFMNAINSWSARVLDNLAQRVEVLKVFALSRVYYVASILPINVTMIKKFEKEIGKFLWARSGKILRVALDEIKNSPERGGLAVPCLASKCKSLLLSQLLRLLKSEDTKSMAHIGYWMGDLLADFVPGFSGGQHARTTPEYFNYLADLVTEAQISEIITTSNWKEATCKSIYFEYAKAFSTPKVEIDAGVCYKKVWSRLNSPLLAASVREILFLLLHNKLQVKERMFRIGKADNPFCNDCPGRVVCDVRHFFCSCIKVTQLWGWLRGRLVSMGGDVLLLSSDWEIINLFMPRIRREKEVAWLIGNYTYWVWFEKQVKNKSNLKMEHLFGFLRFKYKALQQEFSWALVNSPGLGL